MNGDLQELMTHIGNLHNQQMEAIADVRADIAQYKGNSSARIEALEEAQKQSNNRQWVHSIVVAAIGALHHTLGIHFGWKV